MIRIHYCVVCDGEHVQSECKPKVDGIFFDPHSNFICYKCMKGIHVDGAFFDSLSKFICYKCMKGIHDFYEKLYK